MQDFLPSCIYRVKEDFINPLKLKIHEKVITHLSPLRWSL
jgi:hypothetical protein